MAIRAFRGKQPQIGKAVYVDDSAVIIGEVVLGDDVSIWPAVVARGDIHRIEIGAGTNVQDGSVLHVTHDSRFSPGGHPLKIGQEVTIGHRVTLHGCTVGTHCLIGIGSIIMDGAVIGDQVMIGAGSLVPPGKRLTSGYLYLGAPIQQIRPLKEQERELLLYSAKHYIRLKNQYLGQNEEG